MVWVVAVAVMLSLWPFRYVVSRCFGGFCGGTVEVFWEVVSRCVGNFQSSFVGYE